MFKLVGVLFCILATQAFAESEGLPAADDGCRADWKACADNEDLYHNNGHMINVMTACQVAANSRSRHGKIDWGGFFSLPFDALLPGRDYVDTGIVKIAEKDALVPNKYGGQTKSLMICVYDLNADELVGVMFDE